MKASTFMDPSCALGTPATKSALGTTPAPTTTMSAGSTVPLSRTTSLTTPWGPASNRLTVRRIMNSTPLSSPIFWITAPTSLPSTRSMGTASMPTTTTRSSLRESLRADAASMPMKEEPMMTAVLESPAATRTAAESAAERIVKMCLRSAPGTLSLRGVAPEATRTLSKAIWPPSERIATLVSASSSFTFLPVSSSTPCSSYQPWGRREILSRGMPRILVRRVRS
mmetsp:Transcript_18358/g.50608  ORF Transcript_18358/g.50608 Transcript_18358/m.50608 type:complete len:225 (+) Transcript_18358:531-1205(+)